jgi:hypothetical protein
VTAPPPLLLPDRPERHREQPVLQALRVLGQVALRSGAEPSSADLRAGSSAERCAVSPGLIVAGERRANVVSPALLPILWVPS